MNKNKKKLIRDVLEDLYSIDSSFKSYEKDLKRIIIGLVELKPDTALDEAFKRRLQAQLIEEIEKMERKKAAGFSLSGLFSNKRLAYVSSGVFLTLLVAIPTFVLFRNYFITKPEEVLSPLFSVESMSEKAFGQLQLVQDGEAAENELATGKGGGGSESYAIPDVPGSEIGIKRPEIVSYTYIYKGEDVVLDKDRVEVLKRIKEINSSSAFKNIVKSLDFGLLNMSSFPGSKVERISFAQGSDYVINVDFLEGSVYINRSWRNEQTVVKCLGEGCIEPQPLKPSDIPSDSRLIETANNFIREHGIDLSMYGQPEVSSDWKWMLAMPESYFVPSIVRIVYPLVIDGEFVFDEGGNKVGLGVSINLYDMKVNSVDGLTSHNYQKSLYEAETDFSKIVSIAEKGGIRGGVFYGDVMVKTVEVELDTPSLVYMKAWNHNNGQSEELLVPSLMFPVIGAPDSFYRESVVVPLVTDLLSDDIIGPFPMPEIME